MPRPLLISSQSDYLIEIQIFNDKQCRSRSVGFFNCSGSTQFAKTGYVVVSKNIYDIVLATLIYKDAQSLRKHAYSNILKILAPKHENFQIKNSDIFRISAQNIDCGYSLEPPR